MNNIEIWKDIPGYEGYYQVSTFGRVKSVNRTTENHRKTPKDTKWYRFFPEKQITPELTHTGYLRIKLTKLGKRNKFYVHRLVAAAFIENPMNLPYVNHIDENKINNNVTNLEWCDHDYNMHYGTLQKRKAESHKKKIVQYSKLGEYIKTWDSATDAAKALGFVQQRICYACMYDKVYKNYIWRYKE